MGNASNAYLPTEPFKQDATSWLRGVEDQNFRYNQDQRQALEIQQRMKEREEARLARLDEKYKALKVNPTGLKSLDDFMYRILDDAAEMRLQLYHKELSGTMTIEDRLLFNKLEETPERLLLITDSYKAESGQYFENLKAGKIKKDIEYEAKLNKLIDGGVPFLDDDGEIVVGFDRDGDGNNEYITHDPKEGLNMKPTFVPNIDYGTVVENISKRVEPAVNQTDDNYREIKTTGISLAEAQGLAKSEAIGADGKPTSVTVSYLWDRGIKPGQITQEDIDGFVNKMAGDIMIAEKRGREENMDYSARNQAIKDAKEEKKEITFSITKTPPAYSMAGIKTAEGYGAVAVTGSPRIPSLKYYSKAIESGERSSDKAAGTTELTNATLKSYTVAKADDGTRHIIAEVVWQDSKGSTLSAEDELTLKAPNTTQQQKDLILSKVNIGAANKSKVIPLTEADAGIFAKQMGFNDVNEMKDAARVSEEEEAAAMSKKSNVGGKYN